MSTRSNLSSRENVAALILAAGEGRRAGNRPKAFLPWREKSLLQHAVERVAPFASQVVIGVRADDMEQARQIVAQTSFVNIVVETGGATRLETVERLMQHARRETVLVHEAARPFADEKLFARVLENLPESGVVVPVVSLPMRDGIGVRDGANLKYQVPREQLVSLQIPQAFRLGILRDVLQRARGEKPVADSLPGLALAAGYTVHLVEGCARNRKITFEDDLQWLRE